MDTYLQHFPVKVQALQQPASWTDDNHFSVSRVYVRRLQSGVVFNVQNIARSTIYLTKVGVYCDSYATNTSNFVQVYYIPNLYVSAMAASSYGNATPPERYVYQEDTNPANVLAYGPNRRIPTPGSDSGNWQKWKLAANAPCVRARLPASRHFRLFVRTLGSHFCSCSSNK